MNTDAYDFIDETILPETYKAQNSIRIPDFKVWNGIFAVSKDFAKAAKHFTVCEMKALAYALTEVDFRKPMPDAVVLDKKLLANAFGIKTKSGNRTNIIKKKIAKIATHSEIEYRDNEWNLSGEKTTIIDTVEFSPVEKIIISFTEDGRKLFGNLQAGNYLIMSTGDIFRMRNINSAILYEYFRYMSFNTAEVNSIGIGIKRFKTLFSMPQDGPGSYMRKKGGFDRSNFEKKVLEPICDDLKKCQMIKLTLDGGNYLKERDTSGMRVKGYKFQWSIEMKKEKWNFPEEKSELTEASGKETELSEGSVGDPEEIKEFSGEEIEDKEDENDYFI